MRCEERRDEILLYAANALEEAERRELDGHLGSGCPRCAGVLAEVHTMMGLVPLALDPLAPDPAVRERLMARIDAEPSQSARWPTPGRVPPSRRWVPAAAAAAVTFLLVSLIFGMRQARLETELGRQETRIAQLEVALEETAALEEIVARQDTEIQRLRAGADRAMRTARLLRSSETEIVQLAGKAAGLEASARLMWDRGQQVGHLFASGLKPAGPAKVYQLWFITKNDEKISAGTFEVDPTGEAELQMAVPPGIGAIAAAAVTDEPRGGSPQPTGSIQLVGAVVDRST